jgi:uncharacterized membrane protein
MSSIHRHRPSLAIVARVTRAFVPALLTCVIGSGAALAQPAASFQGLGYGPGNESVARGISADGSTVVGHAIRPHDPDSTGEVPFRWTRAQGMQQLAGFAPLEEARAQAVSGDGSVVVGNSVAGKAFVWSAAGGPGPIPGMDPMSDAPVAIALGADGSTIVGIPNSAGAAGRSALRWHPSGGARSLGTLSGFGASFANGVSPDGSVVVGQSRSAAGDEASRWTRAGGMQGLGDLPAGSPTAKPPPSPATAPQSSAAA